MRIRFIPNPGDAKRGWVVWREKDVRRRGPPAHRNTRLYEGTYLGRPPPGENN